MENIEDQKRHWFGQPRGLSALFFTELWERFSYYGMRAILLYYLYYEITKGGLGMDYATALSVVSIYGSLVYMSSVVGGWLADRVFGPSKVVFIGGVLIMLGHICLAIPARFVALFAALALIIIGTGMLKPNISTLVGKLYSDDDPRRDAGFSIFYMGINIGGFVSPPLVGILRKTFNFHVGFSLAAFGMLFGLIVYVINKKKYFDTLGNVPTNPLSPEERKSFFIKFFIALVVVVAFLAISVKQGFFSASLITNIVTALSIFLAIFYIGGMLVSPKVTSQEKKNMKAYIFLFIAAVLFYSILEQSSTVIAGFADKRTVSSFFNPEWFQSVNPLVVMILSPFFAIAWTKLGKRQPSTISKFSFSLFIAGLSFILLAIPGLLFGTNVKVSPLWLLSSLTIMTIGELFLSPVGYAATTRLAPKAFQSQTMAVWLLSNSVAQAINAQVAGLYVKNEILYFLVIGGYTIAFGLILFFARNSIKKLME